MPKLTLFPSGIKASFSSAPTETRGKRGGCKGWTYAAARRNDLFLRSIEPGLLTGIGFALTLTVRDCPDTHDGWEQLRRAYVERLRRLGFLRLHWLTEWQLRARGSSRDSFSPVPHFHLCVYFDEDTLRLAYEDTQMPTAELLKLHWLDLTADRFGAKPQAQFVRSVDGTAGWFGYLAKHGARGVFHYQRMTNLTPVGWEKTGRLWGKSGDWPTRADEYVLTPCAFYALRRVMRRIQLQQAHCELRKARTERHTSQALKRIAYLRKAHCGTRIRDTTLSPARRASLLYSIGRVSAVSEWIDMTLVHAWLLSCCHASRIELPDADGELYESFIISLRHGDHETICGLSKKVLTLSTLSQPERD